MAKKSLPRGNKYRRRTGKLGAVDVKHDGSVVDLSVAAECYNLDGTSGALRPGYGIVEDESLVPNYAVRYWIYNRFSEEENTYVKQRVYQIHSGQLCFWSDSYDWNVFITGQQYPPFDVINYKLDSKDVILLSCDGRRLFTWNGRNLVEHQNSPMISSMALHYERLFVTSRDEKYKVFFSKNLDPTDWDISADGGGFIDLLDERGYCNRVVSFGSYLYVFRERGISRITAFGDQSEFAVVNLFVTAGRIFPSSIVTCGNVIMFMASDGLYVFDGYDCRRVLENLKGLIVPSDDCACAYHDGRYFLACKMDFRDGKKVGCENDEYKVNGLLAFDPNSGEYVISRGMDIRFMNSCSFNGKDYLMACDVKHAGIMTKCGSRYGEPLPKHWKSPEFDFGMPDKQKRVRGVMIKSDGPAAVTVDGDGISASYEIDENTDRIKLFVSCYRLAVAVDIQTADCNVTPFTVTYSAF